MPSTEWSSQAATNERGGEDEQGNSVADPGCLSRISETATKERGEKKICCQTFFCSHKFHKIVNYFFLMLKKKI
jgi:hypothetical protein